MSLIGSPAGAIDTPALLVDLDQFSANVRRFAEMVASAGARLRPHIKTHKTIEIARMQLEASACGISCAKLGEAEVYVEAAWRDCDCPAAKIAGRRPVS